MKKDSNLTSAKEALRATAEKVIKSTEETKENVGKTINAVKDTAKSIKTRTTKATTAAKKTIAKKIDVGFYVQYHGKEISKKTILEKVYEEWIKSHKISELKTLSVYIKVEEDTAYCLVNEEIKINLKLS
ncbi:DUF6465 family protein [Clostridium bowmanii]|uniref:DUF6465 family protein n=1 Tax=Clostridium bowmanii TaxID=132925 RepID=UPI001C0E89DC|nr:DUF6465 family protein [Clostridium bowmanii]MBU3189917.1 hypothetical protein [Clostridium bowmanii]MCA1074401.1 DUF6465 family protein [Clostridium bowmanii]